MESKSCLFSFIFFVFHFVNFHFIFFSTFFLCFEFYLSFLSFLVFMFRGPFIFGHDFSFCSKFVKLISMFLNTMLSRFQVTAKYSDDSSFDYLPFILHHKSVREIEKSAWNGNFVVGVPQHPICTKKYTIQFTVEIFQ